MTAEAKQVPALRCWRCAKVLAEEITPPYRITCPRCHARNAKDAEAVEMTDKAR